MDPEFNDGALSARLKRLEAATDTVPPAFGYDGLVERHAARAARAKRRLAAARGTAAVLVVALAGLSLWRIDRDRAVPVPEAARSAPTADGAAAARAIQPRMVRADTYLAVAVLEDHIASLDDALTDARLRGGGSEVARLERTRAELMDSYTQVRYAEQLSANY